MRVFSAKIFGGCLLVASIFFLSPTAHAADPSALLLLRSARGITTMGGAAIKFTVGIKNTGSKAWNLRELRIPDFVPLADKTQHDSWATKTVVMAKGDGPVAPGSLDLFSFTFSAPQTQGSYTTRFLLAVDTQVIPGFFIDIPLEVTSDAPHIAVIQPIAGILGQDPISLMAEPIIRVGILIVDDETANQVHVGCRAPWKLRDENNTLLGELSPTEKVLAFFKKGRYWFNRGKGLETTSFPLRFIPDEKNAVCQVENFDRRITRGSDRAYNTFRHILELRHNLAKNRTWLINELPMEFYLKGLGETSNDSATEFQKALIMAARTFALYHWERGTKRGSEGFHITAYADDQVYHGFEQEEQSPNIVQAAEATRGKILTYEERTALTPYFSRSDGRTRDWSEVWGGAVPWLKSVPAPCDLQHGYKLWGHGVGLSASEALCQANQGQRWRDILNYFYRGTSVITRWI